MTDTHVIVVGNEKGGSGKTTVAMHVAIALIRSGYKVGVLDLDLRQKSLSRYLENRAKWGVAQKLTPEDLPMPKFLPVQGSNHDSRATAKAQEQDAFGRTLMEYQGCEFVVIDSPGADTHLSRIAHMHADTIVTPMNDSFVDYDLLARIDPGTGEIQGPSLYAEMVWAARQHRAQSGVLGGIDWVVARNRLSATNAKNKKAVGEKLDQLSKRIQFRQARGFGERVIYRELFTAGMTLLDLGGKGAPRKLGSMSHLAARQEVRSLLAALRLPQVREQVAKDLAPDMPKHAQAPETEEVFDEVAEAEVPETVEAPRSANEVLPDAALLEQLASGGRRAA
ncbi:division plane positioning ATPase MipZ [Parvularcula dongshanensis]|uniref:Chromosome partitioning protein n=1 Tax=Parvularcula dongshanensis TaxID=1173995 RepID=A0A840I4P2_9PROT|nr:division plane positioning ATPase MipZ [Parvularcula dongshanensis]MBB4659174.1 chromosome partitioning protein [Parvularcula dongshanensis]